LNISVACAVSLFEAFRQRTVAGLYDTRQFSDEEFTAKFLDWQQR
jgi:tRNA (guanosine-2'-O-)-methyltransferase